MKGIVYCFLGNIGVKIHVTDSFLCIHNCNEYLLEQGQCLQTFTKKSLLDKKLSFCIKKGSGQMQGFQRVQIVKAIHPEYVGVNGLIKIHGTDMGADKVMFLHLAFFYNNPQTVWKGRKRVINSKPVLALSSRLSGAKQKEFLPAR